MTDPIPTTDEGLSRRKLCAALAATIGAVSGSKTLAASSSNKPPFAGRNGTSNTHDMPGMAANWSQKQTIVMIAYPGMTALDLVGPQYMFGSLMGATVHVASLTRDPIVSDTNLIITPTASFDECPKSPTILFVPGGTAATLNAIRNDKFMEFVASRGTTAQYVTSVCTGSLVLAAAGLLKGYRATSHWIGLDLLHLAGAIPVSERVVIDRNRITGAGVSAGLDFGLTIVGILRDQFYAETVQLLCEYAPQPPYTSGDVKTAPERSKKFLTDMLAGFRTDATSLLNRDTNG